jgi:TetR/AcrR family tetracycline transcriptional repressor
MAPNSKTEAPARDADKARLSKDAVLDRALALGDAQGLEAVTIRRLAQELGVTPMALYWHFRGKDELLAALGDRVWAEMDVAVDTGADWTVQLRALMESLLTMLRAHPCASQLLMAGEKLHGEASLLVTETALAVLGRGGFDPERASEITRSALWTGLMLVMSEAGFSPGLGRDARTEVLRQQQIRLAMLPPDKFPCLVAAAEPMTACDQPEFHYSFGIDLFIAGVVALASDNGKPGSQ